MATQQGIVRMLNGDTRVLDFPFSDAEDHDIFQVAGGKFVALNGTDELGKKKYIELAASDPRTASAFVDNSVVMEASNDNGTDPDQT